MQTWIIRILFGLLAVVFGYLCKGITGLIAGLVIATVLMSIEAYLKRNWLYNLLICITGLTAGLIAGGLIIYILSNITGIESHILSLSVTLVLGYAGMMGLYYRYNNPFSLPINIENNDSDQQDLYTYKVLDTSVIIDGRIYDICQTGFIDGTLIIPRFVLKELQNIADSREMLRRNKGRRGFEVLRKMQENPEIKLEISEKDFTELSDVDAKIVRLARDINAKVITNDFNLNRTAELQGLIVLNVNELANSVKPVVVPGELISVRVIREGKEFNQGVGYLDDGTMVIVEDGKHFVGQTIDVVVTQTLQTSAGRMIFTRKQNENNKKYEDEVENDSDYTSGWSRDKDKV